jgi:hypothetical protein
MSKETPIAKKPVKTVRIKENDLVDLIDNIVAEALAVKKQEWISEQKANANSILESKIADLEAKFNKLTEGKK